MIARRLSIAWVVVPLLIASNVCSQGPPKSKGFTAAGLKMLDERLKQGVERNEYAGAVALLIRDGKVGYSRAVGMRDREAGERMRTDALFRIASMTKPITSVAAMILVEDGRLALDDPVAKYIREFKDAKLLDGRPATHPMTVRHLLTHTAGLSYRFFDGPLAGTYAKAGVSDGLSQTEGVIAEGTRLIAAQPLLFEPGTSWQYSLATDVLGRVVEVASGKPLDELFRERIFTPLKMDDTAFFLDPAKADRLAILYQAGEGHTLTRAPETPIKNGTLVYSSSYHHKGPHTYFSGGAGLTSTAGDYARFLQMLLNGGELDGARVLKPETVTMMTSDQITGIPLTLGSIHGDRFGLGFGVVTAAGKAETPMSPGSYGWGGFFHTIFWVDPEKKLIGILMTQVFPAATTIQPDFVKAAYEALGN